MRFSTDTETRAREILDILEDLARIVRSLRDISGVRNLSKSKNASFCATLSETRKSYLRVERYGAVEHSNHVRLRVAPLWQRAKDDLAALIGGIVATAPVLEDENSTIFGAFPAMWKTKSEMTWSLNAIPMPNRVDKPLLPEVARDLSETLALISDLDPGERSFDFSGAVNARGVLARSPADAMRIVAAINAPHLLKTSSETTDNISITETFPATAALEEARRGLAPRAVAP